MEYNIFKWDSHNTGRYVAGFDSLMEAQTYAKQNGHVQIDGQNGFFQEYENGEIVSWSVAGNGIFALVAIHKDDSKLTQYV